MSVEKDRLLSERKLIELIRERFGLSACGIIEAIRDCESEYPGEDKEKK